jgi:hypothetical protein
MTDIDNARGYAFVAFKNAHSRQLHWSKYAAALKHGYYPSLYEYTEDGLNMFDRMYATATHDLETVQDLTYDIIKAMAQSIDEEHRGHFKYVTKDRDSEHITTAHDVILDQPVGMEQGHEEFSTIGSVMPVIERGYAEFEDADLMKMRLRLIASRMTDADMKVLLAYVNGETDTLGGAVTDSSIQSFIKRMRTACKPLQGSVVFG